MREKKREGKGGREQIRIEGSERDGGHECVYVWESLTEGERKNDIKRKKKMEKMKA